MKIIKRIIGFVLIFILISTNINYGKFNYVFNLKAFSLNRENSEIVYEIIKKTNSDRENTNQDVILTINLNKPVENVVGFEKSDDGMSLTRVITENETNSIIVEDMSGNKKQINYEVNSIDKILPEILGVENDAVYDVIDTYNFTENGSYQIIITDMAGNIAEKNITIKK